MNIVVCIKQVPDTTEIKIDPVTNTLIRAGVPSIVNPFDAYALEIAARIKDVTPETKIILLSMGPKQAEAALKECLAVGGDKAYLVSDRAFGGADTLATSYILSRAIAAVEAKTGEKFDLIFCRNVMIYFDRPTKAALVRRFYDATAPGGYLFIGHSESLDKESCPFSYIEPAIYRKI